MTFRHLGIVLLEGGTDTTSGFLQSMVLMMTAFPEIQLRAQKEIDGLVGESRLPNIDDIDQLPYVAALIKEVYSHMWSRTSRKLMTCC